jgi:hypothetical protein
VTLPAEPFENPSLRGVDLSTANLCETFRRLDRVPAPASSSWHQRRGYGLERLVAEALAWEGLQPRSPFVVDGEQIDGSLVLDGHVCLIEAK